jgi:integrase
MKFLEREETMAEKKRGSHDGKRRGNGEGTISWRSKEGRYEGRYWVQTSRGPKRKVVYDKDWEECRRKLARAIADRDDGLIFDAEDLSVAEYMRLWLRGPAKKNVRPSTHARYEQLGRKHIISSSIGKLKLGKLTAVHLEALYDLKLEEGLSPRTVNYVHVTISKALKHAVRKDLIRRNVASFAEAPQPDGPEISPLNANQAAAFLRSVSESGDRLEALYVLALSTGMRRSEILGLMEDDLDLDVGTLQIQRGLTVHPEGGVTILGTKRKASQRLLELSPETVVALKRHRTRRAEERLAATHWDEQGFVFTKRTGGYLHPNTLYTAYFKPARDRAGIPPIHFHDLRHTYATLALLGGVPVKVVSEVLGHKDVSTTLRTYAHVLPGMQAKAAKTMDSILF